MAFGNFSIIQHLPPAHFLIRLFRSATDFEGGAYRLLGGAGEAEGAASPSKREHRRQMAEALLGAEPDAQGYSISSCFTFIDQAEKHFTTTLSLKKLFLSLSNVSVAL